MTNMPWECPRCHRINAPWMSYCTGCIPPDPIDLKFSPGNEIDELKRQIAVLVDEIHAYESKVPSLVESDHVDDKERE